MRVSYAWDGMLRMTLETQLGTEMGNDRYILTLYILA